MKFKRITIAILICFLFSCSDGGGSSGSGAEFSGVITKSSDRQPLSNINVYLLETGASATTAQDGSYSFVSEVPTDQQLTYVFEGQVENQEVNFTAPKIGISETDVAAVEADWAVKPDSQVELEKITVRPKTTPKPTVTPSPSPTTTPAPTEFKLYMNLTHKFTDQLVQVTNFSFREKNNSSYSTQSSLNSNEQLLVLPSRRPILRICIKLTDLDLESCNVRTTGVIANSASKLSCRFSTTGAEITARNFRSLQCRAQRY